MSTVGVSRFRSSRPHANSRGGPYAVSGMKMGLSIKMLLSLDALRPVHTLVTS